MHVAGHNFITIVAEVHRWIDRSIGAREHRERRAGDDDGFLWSLQAARVRGERGGVAARRPVAGRHVCLGGLS